MKTDLQNKRAVIARPLLVGVGGFTSEVGKTTLLCELLKMCPGWEAIKTTRGHYRSCGKDPHACCVSDLLGEKAVVRSGREQTYAPGKDTGRYWDAGAENVHWVIATDEQLGEGVREAISRVTSGAVLVEGNSFSQFIAPDFFIMVGCADVPRIKRSARNALEKVSAFYVSDRIDDAGDSFQKLWDRLQLNNSGNLAPVFSSNQVAQLAERVRHLTAKFLPEKQTHSAKIAS